MASRIAFLVNFRGVCEVDFVFMRSEEVLFVEGFLRPLLLLNARMNGNRFIETFLKHFPRTQPLQICLEKSEAKPRHGLHYINADIRRAEGATAPRNERVHAPTH